MGGKNRPASYADRHSPRACNHEGVILCYIITQMDPLDIPLKLDHWPKPAPPPIPESVLRSDEQGNLRMWFYIRGDGEYWRAPENQCTDRPLRYLFLGDDRPANLNAYMLGKRPKAVGSWTVYICRACLRMFVRNCQLRFMRKPHCGCLDAAPGASRVQSARLEGQRYGDLTVTRYVAGQGWECLCECGAAEGGISTVQLRKLYRLACRTCAPEEYTHEGGSKTYYSKHKKLLREHLERVKGGG